MPKSCLNTRCFGLRPSSVVIIIIIIIEKLIPRFFSAFKTNMAAREHFTEETRLFYSIQRLFICWKVFRNHLNKCMEVLGLLNLTEMICEKDSHVGTL